MSQILLIYFFFDRIQFLEPTYSLIFVVLGHRNVVSVHLILKKNLKFAIGIHSSNLNIDVKP